MITHMNKEKTYRKIAISLFLGLSLLILIFSVMLLFNVTDYGITIASFGASVFMVLSKKKISYRQIFGSYIIASIIGFIFSKLPISSLFAVATAVVSSVAVMTFLETQHTPAIGISIAMVLNKFSFWTDLIVVLSILTILGIAVMLKSFVKDPKKLLNFVKIETDKINWDF